MWLYIASTIHQLMQVIDLLPALREAYEHLMWDINDQRFPMFGLAQEHGVGEYNDFWVSQRPTAIYSFTR